MKCLGYLLLLAPLAMAQSLSTASLTGKYFVRHLQFTTDANNNATDTRSVLGTLQFDGTGTYSFTGQQTIGTAAPSSYTVTGTYSVDSAGIATLTNPQNKALNLNARYSAESLVGSSTDAPGNTFDFLVAIPAPSGGVTNATVSANWSASDFELTAGTTSQVRSATLALPLNGLGDIGNASVTGHVANLNGGATLFQTVAGAKYNLTGDGTGTVTFPTGTLLSGVQRTLYVSRSGNVMIAASPGAHDILLAIRNSASAVTIGNGQRFWLGGIRVDSSGSSASYVGAANALTAQSTFVLSQRFHQSGFGVANVTQAGTYTFAGDGTGSVGSSRIAIEQAGNVEAAHIGNVLDPTGYEITFGGAMPPVSGSGVFVNPQGIVNVASLAPAGDAISPGEFIAIFGSGMASATTQAGALPFPTALGGVTVTIGGLPAPVYFVSTGQIDCIVPYKLNGTTANVVVTNNGVASNSVSVRVAVTSPGVFTIDGSGTGSGSITHADGSIVSASKPAKKGETIVMYVSGLGVLSTPVLDGFGTSVLNNAATTLTVYVAGIPVPPANVLYQGLTGYAGLYQINFVVPTTLTTSGNLPVAIQTPDSYTDLVNISVQ